MRVAARSPETHPTTRTTEEHRTAALAAPERVEARHSDAAPQGLPRGLRGRRTSRHGPVAQLLIASSPLSLILVTYALGDWIDATIDLARPHSTVNRLGFGLHETAAASVDRHLFGTVPAAWLQLHLVGDSPHWYDGVAALVYGTHFVAIPLLTAFVWFRCRDRYQAWIAAVLAFIAVGVAGYVVFPASPPWMAARAGLVEPVSRISGSGWHYLHLGPVGRLIGSGQAGSNPIAAMPSLHAGGAMLVVLFLWPLVGARWRPVLVAYPLLMGLALVYTGEHYALDVVAGWLTAAVAARVGVLVLRRGPTGLGSRRLLDARPRLCPPGGDGAVRAVRCVSTAPEPAGRASRSAGRGRRPGWPPR